MSNIFLTVKDNTKPALKVTVYRKNTSGGKNIVDLTGMTSVKLYIYNTKTKLQTNTGHEACTVLTPATNGVVQYDLQAGDLAAVAEYKGEIELNYGGGTERAFEQITIKVRNKGL
jgi:hypothetical protein